MSLNVQLLSSLGSRTFFNGNLYSVTFFKAPGSALYNESMAFISPVVLYITCNVRGKESN